MSVDLLAWDFFLGLAMIFASRVFQGGGIAGVVRVSAGPRYESKIVLGVSRGAVRPVVGLWTLVEIARARGEDRGRTPNRNTAEHSPKITSTG
jgi:hypothetical protein